MGGSFVEPVVDGQRVHRAFRYEISTASGERGPNQADDVRRGELDAPRFADLVCLTEGYPPVRDPWALGVLLAVMFVFASGAGARGERPGVAA
jgi:hypothetical protein